MSIEVLTITIPSVLPTVMVVFGILSNKNVINHVRTEIASLRGEISNVRAEMGRCGTSSIPTS